MSVAIVSLASLVLSAAVSAQATVEPDAIDASHVGKEIRVDGVISGITKRGEEREVRLLLARKVKFLPNGEYVDNLKGNVEIVGFVRQGTADEIVVDVKSITPLPDDGRRFDDRRQLLGAADYRGLLELSRWAEGRGRRYNRPEVADRGRAAYADAVALWRAVEKDDPAALRSLKTMLERDKILEGYDYQGLDHQALWAESRKLGRRDPAALTAFAGGIGPRLGLEPSPRDAPLTAAEQAAYDADPVARFDAANAADRQRLARYWQVKLLTDALAVGLKDDEARDLAYKAREAMPDYPGRVTAWFRQWADEQRKKLPSLERPQVVLLADTLARELNDEKGARKVTAEWLSLQEDALRRDRRDTGRRMELARLHGDWRGEAGKLDARRLAEDAVRFDPTNEAARSLLRELTGAAAAPAASPRERGVSVGMRADDVLRTLGPPTRRSRVVTRHRASGLPQTHHYWGYRGLNETFWIVLEQAGGEPTVVETRSAPK